MKTKNCYINLGLHISLRLAGCVQLQTQEKEATGTDRGTDGGWANPNLPYGRSSTFLDHLSYFFLIYAGTLLECTILPSRDFFTCR